MISAQKTKLMTNITNGIQKKKVGIVRSFKYLRAIVSDDGPGLTTVQGYGIE